MINARTDCPYPTQPGYGKRVRVALRKIETYGRDPLRPPRGHAYERCLEMFDGEAVVWALMDAASRNSALADGIRRMGCWESWQVVYLARQEPVLPFV